jgi:hypothetical protein
MRTPADLAWEDAGRQEWMRISQPACYGPIARGAVDDWTGAPLTTCDPPIARMRAYIKAHFADPDVAAEAAHVLFGDPASHGTLARNPMNGEATTVTRVVLGVEAWRARCALEVNFPQIVCSTLRDIPYEVDCAKTFSDRFAQEKATKTYWENGFLRRMDVNGSFVIDTTEPTPAPGAAVVITKRCPRAASDAQVRAWSQEAFQKMMRQGSAKKH